MAEEKKEKKEEGSADEADNPGASKKKKLIIFGAIGGVVVIGIAVGAYMFLAKGTDKSEHAATDAKSTEHEQKPAPAEHGGGHKAEEKKTDHDGGKADGKGEKKEGTSNTTPAQTKEAEDDSGIDFGQTYLFAPFHMNLGNPLENRYVRLEISLEYKDPSQKTEIEKRLPQLRDAIVSIASRKTREFLLAPDGKDQLRKEIKTRLNRFMTKPIESVYITDILIE